MLSFAKRDRFFDRLEWRHRHRRSEQLVARDAHVGMHVGDDRRQVNRATSAAAGHQSRAAADSFIDPFIDAHSFALFHHRADFVFLVELVSRGQRFDFGLERAR